MKLVMTLILRDEADVLEANLRHLLEGSSPKPVAMAPEPAQREADQC